MSVNTHIFGGLPSLMANFEHLTDVSHLTDDELSEMAERASVAVSECTFIMETVGRLLDRMARLSVLEQELSHEETVRFSNAVMCRKTLRCLHHRLRMKPARPQTAYRRSNCGVASQCYRN